MSIKKKPTNFRLSEEFLRQLDTLVELENDKLFDQVRGTNLENLYKNMELNRTSFLEKIVADQYDAVRGNNN